MRTDSKTGLITLEQREEWDDPMFRGVTLDKYYARTDNPGVVVVGCRKPDHHDWLAVETPWDWIPAESRKGMLIRVL